MHTDMHSDFYNYQDFSCLFCIPNQFGVVLILLYDLLSIMRTLQAFKCIVDRNKFLESYAKYRLQTFIVLVILVILAFLAGIFYRVMVIED